MLSKTAYLTARKAAPLIEAHFARHRAASAEDETGWPPPTKRDASEDLMLRSDCLQLLESSFYYFRESPF